MVCRPLCQAPTWTCRAARRSRCRSTPGSGPRRPRGTSWSPAQTWGPPSASTRCPSRCGHGQADRRAVVHLLECLLAKPFLPQKWSFFGTPTPSALGWGRLDPKRGVNHLHTAPQEGALSLKGSLEGQMGAGPKTAGGLCYGQASPSQELVKRGLYPPTGFNVPFPVRLAMAAHHDDLPPAREVHI